MRKGGAGLDLPMAIALLVAGEVLRPPEVAGMAFLGELGLDGSLRRVPGVVPLVDAISQPIVVVPPDCAGEAAVLGRHQVRTAPNLRQLVEAVRGERPWPVLPSVEAATADEETEDSGQPRAPMDRCPNWPMCGASVSAGGPWRWRPPADTTCC